MTESDDLIGDGSPFPRTAEPNKPIPVDLRKVGRRSGRPRLYGWSDSMQPGTMRWLPGEMPAGAVASTIRSRHHRPGKWKRFIFRSDVVNGERGCWCICIDVRTAEGGALSSRSRT